MWWQGLAKAVQSKREMDGADTVSFFHRADVLPEANAKVDTASVMLLRHTDGILPLSQNTRLAVVGELASDQAGFDHRLSALIECFPSCIGYAPGLSGESMITGAETLASEAECVLLFLRAECQRTMFCDDQPQQYLTREQQTLYQRISACARRLVLILRLQCETEMPEFDSCSSLIFTSPSQQLETDALIRHLSGISK